MPFYSPCYGVKFFPEEIYVIYAQIFRKILHKIFSQKMLITLLAIATELHLLFSNKSSICIDINKNHYTKFSLIK